MEFHLQGPELVYYGDYGYLFMLHMRHACIFQRIRVLRDFMRFRGFCGKRKDVVLLQCAAVFPANTIAPEICQSASISPARLRCSSMHLTL
jgi:hypothetical protein